LIGADKHPLLGQSLLAKKDTWLTRLPADHRSIEPEEKLFVPKNAAWEWEQITTTARSLYREVVLKGDTKESWFFYAPDWKVINDLDEKIEYKPRHHIQLSTPYYSARSDFDDVDRTCFSSSCAMLLKTLRPDAFNDWEEYFEDVSDIGEGTEAWVQIKALDQYGVNAEFRQDGNWETIQNLLRQGVPVPMGILHFGPVENPMGSGHWICAVGLTKDEENIIVNDPLGELDCFSGVYTSKNGAYLKYSKKYLGPRWMLEKGYSSGWYIQAKQ